MAALRAQLFEPGMVTEGFTPIELADPGGHELRLRFRWHSDSRIYVRLLPVGPEDLATGRLTGGPVPTAIWANEVRLGLIEDLRTGFVREAARRHESDGIVLVERVNGDGYRRNVYYTTDVPLFRPVRGWLRKPRSPTRPSRGSFVMLGADERDARDWEFDPLAGSWLADAGFDVRGPRRLIADGRLLSWKQLREDTSTAAPAGHAAAGWHPEQAGAARLEVVETLPGVPDDAARRLVASVCHEASDAGAAEIVTDLGGPAIDGAGFASAPAGGTTRRIDLRRR